MWMELIIYKDILNGTVNNLQNLTKALDGVHKLIVKMLYISQTMQPKMKLFANVENNSVFNVTMSIIYLLLAK